MMRTIEKQALSVSPNPSNRIATITTQLKDVNSPSELKVTDVLGNIILTKSLVQQYDKTMIPVDGLASGIYQCSIMQNGKPIMNTKIVVAH